MLYVNFNPQFDIRIELILN